MPLTILPFMNKTRSLFLGLAAGFLTVVLAAAVLFAFFTETH
jgi:hypothetical protein